MRRTDRWFGALAGVLVAAGCAPGPTPATGADCVRLVSESGERSDRCLPTAPRDRRVDLGRPVFSDPTAVTNPLHPTATVRQVVYGGQVDGKPFRSEVTLLPTRRTIEWRGERIEALVSQYLSLSNGRLQEVATDWYAQADDGAVWYLGEDVSNYEDGRVADTNGTWVSGPDAPPAMIMPAHPKPGDVYRPENAPPAVFEEVTVSSVDQTVSGPSGPVAGAITVEELHLDGTREKKTFAPGYGEFSTGNPHGDLEAAMLALPTDARTGRVPPTVDTLVTATRRTAEAVSAADWTAAASSASAVARAWSAARPADLAQLSTQMNRDIDALTTATRAAEEPEARDAALRVAQNALDLRSRYQPVDTARFALWARQLVLDAEARDTAAVSGDHACLKWTFDRIRDELPNAAVIDERLSTVESAVTGGDLAAAARQAETLLSR